MTVPAVCLGRQGHGADDEASEDEANNKALHHPPSLCPTHTPTDPRIQRQSVDGFRQRDLQDRNPVSPGGPSDQYAEGEVAGGFT